MNRWSGKITSSSERTKFRECTAHMIDQERRVSSRNSTKCIATRNDEIRGTIKTCSFKSYSGEDGVCGRSSWLDVQAAPSTYTGDFTAGAYAVAQKNENDSIVSVEKADCVSVRQQGGGKSGSQGATYGDVLAELESKMGQLTKQRFWNLAVAVDGQGSGEPSTFVQSMSPSAYDVSVAHSR